ncbi:bifunctional adenosylcobinamide kinase/adenosylcobinamide-phosphate guanylyltransferase [Shewanella algicola]|uniref:bifunctional adenosylcobinamide kinase/adenosylcobinamide-phosphate guanylyltransferase n=1 Tax=Shewanella algicola TaxID=640633 RepID=UPI002494F04F|nr:bifunctional adenosylcobinamide kinase/adenosylcobinamide-phosphate guanylyltransferase [Shewanella algicola]
MISLFMGGARSGKSALAEAFICSQAAKTQQQISYVATAQVEPSMKQRIELHQQRRPNTWRVIEEPFDLVSLLTANDYSHQWLIIDCLTLWLTNHLIAGNDLNLQITKLIAGLKQTQAHVVLVSTETGLSLVPEDDMSQQFVIASGELHQAVATSADNVIFCQASLANVLKGHDYFQFNSNILAACSTQESLC